MADPRSPSIRHALPTNAPLVAEDNSDNGHIANCIQGCDYLYTTGTSEGLTVYDIRDLDAPRKAGVVPLPGEGFTHDVEVDPSGIAWVTGEDGTFGYDTADPPAPRLVYRSDPSIVNTGGGLPGDDGSGPLDFLHHNMKRTSINVSDSGRVEPAPRRPGSATCWRSPRRTTRSRLRGPGIAADVADHRRAQRGRHDQARAARPLDDRAQRAREPNRPLARDGELLGALVRRSIAA